MQVSPFESCGATVSDLQLATMTDADLTELRAAFSQHGVLFFRDQTKRAPALCASLWENCG